MESAKHTQYCPGCGGRGVTYKIDPPFKETCDVCDGTGVVVFKEGECPGKLHGDAMKELSIALSRNEYMDCLNDQINGNFDSTKEYLDRIARGENTIPSDVDFKED